MQKPIQNKQYIVPKIPSAAVMYLLLSMIESKCYKDGRCVSSVPSVKCLKAVAKGRENDTDDARSFYEYACIFFPIGEKIVPDKPSVWDATSIPVFTFLRLIWIQTDVRLDPNQSENGKYRDGSCVQNTLFVCRPVLRRIDALYRLFDCGNTCQNGV